jgi:choline dehydrogenase
VQNLFRLSVRDAEPPASDSGHCSDGRVLECVAKGVSADHSSRTHDYKACLIRCRKSELIPGPKASAEEIRELARLASASFGHAVGTCKMGVDKLAVVDPELRVQGILGLRVADASVMPQIITGPGTNASAHMIGGRAAKLILG